MLQPPDPRQTGASGCRSAARPHRRTGHDRGGAAAAVHGCGRHRRGRLGAAVDEAGGNRAGRGPAPSRTNRRLLLAGAIGLLVVRVAIVAVLATASVGFVPDRLWGLALSSALTAAAVIAIVRGSRAAPALAGGAAMAAGGEVVFTLVVGAPVAIWAGVVVVVVVITATATWVSARLHWGRRPAAATIAAGAAAVVALTVVGWTGVLAPVRSKPKASRCMGTRLRLAGPDAGAAAAPRTVGTSVADLTGVIDPAAPRVAVHLRAQQQEVRLATGRATSGETVSAWTFGELAGPAITATVGDTLDVTLTNIDVADGVTAHWHGYPVPAASDGVAGVTQDAVAPGGTFHTAFALDRAGTYWYHTHQRGSEGVARGLYGTLVVLPAAGPVADVDVVLPLHTFGRTVVLGTDSGVQHTRAALGDAVRARLVNTDQLPQRFVVSGAPFRVVAIDASDVDTGELGDIAIEIPAGGRYDIEFTMRGDPVTLRAEASDTAVMVFSPSRVEPPPAAVPAETFDPLTRLTAATAPDEVSAIIVDAAVADGFDTEATYVLDRLPRLIHGVPQYAYTVNGAVYPHIPSTVVTEGDVVRLRVVNRGFETHPMHPHGHSVRVLTVDGVAPRVPLWLDTFDVGPGEVWEVAFVADNPGVWMDHCHNLEHAALGMVLHIAYRGVSTPFAGGGHAGNAPE